MRDEKSEYPLKHNGGGGGGECLVLVLMAYAQAERNCLYDTSHVNRTVTLLPCFCLAMRGNSGVEIRGRGRVL